MGEMPLDTFICGNCHVTFNDIELFIVHKRDGCGEQENAEGNAGQSVTYTVEMECPAEIAGTEPGTEMTGEGQDITTVVFPAGGEDQSEMVELSAPEAENSDGSYNQTLLIVTTPAQSKPPGKRRGRGKKKESSPVEKKPARLPLPEKSADGKYHCSRCKKGFGKERHFLTHRCMAASDYVDITKKDIVKLEGDDDMEDDDDDAEVSMEMDDSEEYTLPATVTNEDGDGEAEASVEKSGEAVQDIPIFNSPGEKTAFEESLNVDLSGLDVLFRVHVIEQDLNENASQPQRNAGSNSFFLYSCKTCTKVFKTLSHMRLHCLIHTNLKPFKCTKCDYTCNSKGNLYTHMRKHTGQFYTCSHCEFKTVNKSHLIEHKSTHSAEKHQCEMCHKDYKTQKSLINHIRKYHTSKRGKEYLQRFMTGRQSRGMTIIHQCHVCNRKFKKKIDRDRHLFTHDIKDTPNVKHCELCDYSASRRVYLENHFLKHRVVYQCCECPDRFLSSIRLIDHLSSQHGKDDPANKCDSLFEKCINSSYFLPEPGLQSSNGQTDKCIINLPTELADGEPVQVVSNETVSSLTENVCNGEVADGDASAVRKTKESAFGADVSSTDDITGTGQTVVEENSASQMDTDASTTDRPDSGEKTPGNVVTGTDKTTQVTEEDTVTTDPEHSQTSCEEKTHNNGTGETEPEPMETEPIETEPIEVYDTESGQIVLSQCQTDSQVDGETEHKGMGKRLGKKKIAGKSVKKDAGKDEDEEEEVDLITRLGYRQMSMTIFHKMRETFGDEECEYCGRLFYNKSDYEPHVRTHTGDKPFSCDKCSYRAITKENLKRHVEREHEKVTYPCTECDFVACSRTQFWSHQLKHRGLSTVECPVCKESFDTLKELTAHGTASHPDVPEMDWQKTQGYVQKSQGKMGRRSYKCPYCEKVFFRASSELQKHLWIHQGIKPFKCPLCPYACRSNNNLQAHMLRHSSDKPFSCSECGKAYKSKTALLWHCRSHKGGKLFKCDRCPYEGNQKSHLNRHMETHNVIKRFVCEHCEFSSNTAGYMKIHFSRQHPGKQFRPNHIGQPGKTSKMTPSDTKVYRCLSCDYLFGNLSDMKRHLKERHRVMVDNIYTMESSTGLQQEVSAVSPSAQQTDVQVVQIADQESNLTPSEQDAGAALQALQNAGTLAVPAEDLEEKTASAVNILQQIIDMSQQGAFGQQQITVQSDDGQMMSVNPETIIVQQGEEVVVSSADTGLQVNQQYVIQYVTPEDIIAQEGGPQEPHHVNAPEGVHQDPHQFTIHAQEVGHEEPPIVNAHQEINSEEGVYDGPHIMNTQDVIQAQEEVHTEPQNIILQEVPHDQSILSHEGIVLEPHTVESVALEIVTI